MIALVHAETSTGVRNDIDADRRREGRRPSPRRHGHIARGDPGRGRRLGGGCRLQRDAEVPGRPAGAGAVDGGGPGTAGGSSTCPRRGTSTSDLIARYVEGRRWSDRTTTPRRCRWCSPCTPGSGSCSTKGSRRPGRGTRRAVGGSAGRAREAGAASSWLRPAHRLPQLTTVWVPDDLPAGMSEADGPRGRCCTATGSRSEPGSGHGRAGSWRIGCMGHTARLRNVELLLARSGRGAGTVIGRATRVTPLELERSAGSACGR